MARKAHLKIEQLAHVAQNKNGNVSYGVFRFNVPLDFNGDSKWLIGRSPDLNLYPDYMGLQCVYLPSLYITRTLAVIHSSKSVYDGVHLIETLNDKQQLYDSTTNLPFKKRPMRHGDRFGIIGLKFYTFKYVCVEDKEVSGDLAKDTVY